MAQTNPDSIKAS